MKRLSILIVFEGSKKGPCFEVPGGGETVFGFSWTLPPLSTPSMAARPPAACCYGLLPVRRRLRRRSHTVNIGRTFPIFSMRCTVWNGP